ncbi:translation initiation factor eIF-4E [Babesia microti strain RI]|uniref:Translation initiation factor eIF-4E n=1 Tax=Babesia microti (strain RI) TaxID=1133968 RepID=A0A1N6LW88_BABMR|nr:translation initiation factor eIF-4E [Babesia microti strain RI]SIO73140.1 translation initiation factor eIF-4E [Babesia microti strain RI]|eukprot:XP_021337252.1 translation initiation factor eIF-4E [Babesia microti strain RI]
MEKNAAIDFSGEKTPFLTFNKDTKDFNKIQQLRGTISIANHEKLQLKETWVIWEQNAIASGHSNSTDYKDHTKPLATFNTVQEFWNIWFCMPQPSQLYSNNKTGLLRDDGEFDLVDAYMVFRDKIEPMWEDPMNRGGGHIEYRFRHFDQQPLLIDEFWNNITLGLIGGSVSFGKYITGLRLVDKIASRHPNLRIEVWFQKLVDIDVNQLCQDISQCMARKLDGTIAKPPKGEIKWH